MRHLGRLLLAGYGLAAASSLATHQAGLGVLASVLVFWIGGAVAVVALAVVLTPWMATRPAATTEDDAALAEALRLWEQDRHSDQAAAVAARREDIAAG